MSIIERVICMVGYFLVFASFVIFICLILRISHVVVKEKQWFINLISFLKGFVSTFVTGLLGLPDLVFVAVGFALMYIIERIPFLRRLVSKY